MEDLREKLRKVINGVERKRDSSIVKSIRQKSYRQYLKRNGRNKMKQKGLQCL